MQTFGESLTACAAAFVCMCVCVCQEEKESPPPSSCVYMCVKVKRGEGGRKRQSRAKGGRVRWGLMNCVKVGRSEKRGDVGGRIIHISTCELSADE